jgi:hypothetical protein
MGGQIVVVLLACFGIAHCKWKNKQRDRLPDSKPAFRFVC